MLNTTQTTLANAHRAWPTWSNCKLSQRGDLLKVWANSLTDYGPLAEKMVNYHIRQGIALIAEPQIMPSPTGEINELSTSGRGVFVIATQSEAPELAIIGLISSALIAGNPILLSLSAPQHALAVELCATLNRAGISDSIANHIDNSELLPLIKAPSVAGVAFIGSTQESILINQHLAKRKGQIAQFIVETDHEQLTTVTDYHLLFRFITEKTQTINITAVGGNADLLALGTGDK